MGLRRCSICARAGGARPASAASGCATTSCPPTARDPGAGLLHNGRSTRRNGNGTGYRFSTRLLSARPSHCSALRALYGTRVPDYMAHKMRVANSTIPYYIPFRALTVAGAPNLLVAGKSMATSFRQTRHSAAPQRVGLRHGGRGCSRHAERARPRPTVAANVTGPGQAPRTWCPLHSPGSW